MKVTRNHMLVSELEHGTRYLSPTGRLCMLHPNSTGRHYSASAVLLYCPKDGRSPRADTSDGFFLAQRNWYLLRVTLQ